MIRTLPLFFVCVAGCFFQPNLHAQSYEPSRKISLRVLAFEGYLTDLAVRSPEGRTRVVARSSAFSPEIIAQSTGGEVDFFRYSPSSEKIAPSAAGETAASPVARIAVQPDINRYLVILDGRGEADERVYSAYAIPDAAGSLPVGSARVINFTNAPLAVQLGERSAIVLPAESSVLACPPEGDGHVNLQLACPGDEQKWKLVNRTRVAMPKDRRLLLLVTPSHRQSSPGGGVVMAEAGSLNLNILYDAALSPSASLSALNSH